MGCLLRRIRLRAIDYGCQLQPYTLHIRSNKVRVSSPAASLDLIITTDDFRICKVHGIVGDDVQPLFSNSEKSVIGLSYQNDSGLPEDFVYEIPLLFYPFFCLFA